MCGCRSPLRRACPPPPHIKEAFDLKWYNTISHYKLSFWAAASAQRALAAAVRARPSPLHIKKALASKWYKVTRRAPKGHGIRVYDPPSPRPSPPLRRGERV